MPVISYYDVRVNVNDCPPDVDALLDQAIQRGVPGYRNAAGFALACALRDYGLDLPYATRLMVRYADLVNRQPSPHAYTTAETLASLRSAYSHPRRLRTHPLYGSAGTPPPPICNPPQK
jgi:hypothetical protein